MVGQAVGRPACLQWFRRDAQGGSVGLQGQRLGPALEGRFLSRADFPELLPGETWPDDTDRILVRDYLNWQAPAAHPAGTGTHQPTAGGTGCGPSPHAPLFSVGSSSP
jgi:hypothetical protein